jgi:pimeloyl-ACP methyl ester carboxylesterase
MKKTILLLHGLRGTHHGLISIAKELEKRGYQTLTPDLPGSGERAELSNKTLDGYADWLHDYIKESGVKPYIIGHSMGSIIVSHYLEKYPNDVQKKVVLMSPIFRSKAGQKSSNVTYALANGALHILPKKPRYRFMGSKPVSWCISHFLTADKSRQKEIDELHYKYSGRFASANSLLADMKISMKEQTILPPDKEVLYIIGNRDRLTKVNIARARTTEYGAKFAEIEGTGHLLNYEQPERVAELIDGFIS